MASSKKKSLMRNLGEFFGHIIKGVKEDPRNPADSDSAKPRAVHEVRRETEEIEQDNMILRRTTIEEVEFKSDMNEQNDSQADR